MVILGGGVFLMSEVPLKGIGVSGLTQLGFRGVTIKNRAS